MSKTLFLVFVTIILYLIPLPALAIADIEEMIEIDDRSIWFESSYGNVTNSFSQQAFTGVFTTPNAEVTDYGTFKFVYSNNYFDQYLFRGIEDGFEKAKDLKFAVGLLPNLELVARLGTKKWHSNCFLMDV